MKLPILKKKKVLKTITRSSLCLLLLYCFACKSDNDGIYIPPSEGSINGFWLIAEKGYILELTDDKNMIYNRSSAGCSILNNDFNLEESGFKVQMVNPNKLIVTSQQSLSKLKLTRLPNLENSCLPEHISNTDDPKVNFDHFWAFFNDYYAFFELREVNWTDYKNFGNQITEDNFYDVLEDLVLLFKDGHVSINDEKNDIEIEAGLPSLIERLNTNLSGEFTIENEDDLYTILEQKSRVIIDKYLDGTFQQDSEENMWWGFINGDIAYLNIFGMAGYGSDLSNELTTLNSLLDNIMNDIKNRECLR